MSGYLVAALVLLWVGIVWLIVGGVHWLSRSQPAAQPARDSDYESTITHPPTAHTGREVTLPAARVWKDLPPGWVNTIPSGPMPLDNAKD